MTAAGIDKASLIEEAIRLVEAKLEELRAGYAAARDGSLSTPHVMKSKREVFGQESAYLANALSLNIQERELELRALKALRLPEKPERAALGCLVGLGTSSTLEAVYFILPVCGGMEVSGGDAGRPIRVITPATPVAKALLGKSAGDELVLPTVPPREAQVQFVI
ncbi:MAG TPA: hypothetical protein VMG58_08435 [Candidatus Sulfotelmatobacter sp.]|nr:hypothetical protein [Candidatus Sulfotelmatobacter sp.]